VTTEPPFVDADKQLGEQYLPTERYRDLAGRDVGPWVRRIIIASLLALAILGLLNVFGQEPTTSTASGPAASLDLYSPKRIRGGLLFEARFTVRAFGHDLKEPKLVLDPGWLESMTLNTMEPAATAEHTDNGRIVLEYDLIPAGRRLVVWLQFQANPTNLGTQSQGVELFDGTTRLLGITRSITVFP
jgi:hypothetical protein